MSTVCRLVGLYIAITLLALASPATVSAAGTGPTQAKSIPGEIIVAYRSSPQLLQDAGMLVQDIRPVEERSGVTLAVVRVTPSRIAAMLNLLKQDPSVLYAEPNGIMEGTWTPDDPLYNDVTKVYVPQQIRADRAWDVTRGSSSVLVAVVDSGLDMAHPDLVGALWTNTREVADNGLDDDGNGFVDDVNGWDFANGDNQPADDLGHGTHVTGILAARIDNGVGIAGIAGGIKILPIKVLDSKNQGSWVNIAQGIIYAADQGARAINLSLGATSASQTVQDAVRYAQNRGVLVVASSGNNGTEQLFYPAAYDGVVAVGATTVGGEHWVLSNTGDYISVSAPGNTVYSTYWKAGVGSMYQFMSGTSMASPVVSGVAALIWSVNPALTATQVKAILEATARDAGELGRDKIYGAGEVDAEKAVLATAATLPGDATVSGHLWVDANGDGQHQLNEVTGVSGADVRLHDTQGALLSLVTTDAQGGYVFRDLMPGSYRIDTTTPQGWRETTVTSVGVVLGRGQAVQADFGFVAPTAVNLASFTATGYADRIELAWEFSGADPLQAWDVLRASVNSKLAKRITPDPVMGVRTTGDSLFFRYTDPGVLAGQGYHYWLRSRATGELYGPVLGTARSVRATTVYVPLAKH